MKVAIVGSGAIALSTALQFRKESPNTDVTVIGNLSCFGASRAAGAMLNILSEIDWFNANTPLMDWKLRNRLSCLDHWERSIDNLQSVSPLTDNLIYGKGTEIKLLKDTATDIEKRSFRAMIDCAEEHNVDLVHSSSDKLDTFLIPDEKSVDSNQYLSLCLGFLQEHGLFIHGTVECIERKANSIQLTVGNSIYTFDKLLIAAGSWSSQLIKNSPSIAQPKIDCYNDIGSALLINSEFPHIPNPSIDRIIRTPNRGGTCGIHAVQRHDAIYVGASSHPTQLSIENPKIQSIEALIRGIDQVLQVNTHQISMSTLVGYRPVTADTYPIIGQLDTNIWCLYGTKRDGFTWSNYFANNIIQQVLSGESPSSEWSELLKICNPHRDFTSYKSVEDCIIAYVENKKSEAIQHGVSLSQSEINKLDAFVTSFHHRFSTLMGRSIGVHPDLVNLLNYLHGL